MKESFFKRKLKNGMTIIVEKRDLPVVSACIANRFGGAFEESGIKGIAHFMEHLVFTGTKTRTHEDISREIEKKGGILNAFTANEVTNFWFKLPSEHVFAGLDILVDMLNNPKFDPEKFEKEKKVILEEIKMYHDDPQKNVYEKIEENLYEKPFGEGIIGSESTVKAMNRDFVAKYFQEHYSPENYVAVLVGDVDFEKVCSYFEKNFKKCGKKYTPLKIKMRNHESIEERDGIDQANFIFAFHAPLPDTDDLYALEVLDAYLANGMSSKLFLKIREEKGLAYSVRGSITAEPDYAYYNIYVGTTKEAVQEVKKIILEELKNVESIGEKEMNEAKERLIGLKRLATEESSGVMNELMFSEIIDKAENYYKYEEKIRAVKLEDVKRLARIKGFSSAAIVPK